MSVRLIDADFSRIAASVLEEYGRRLAESGVDYVPNVNDVPTLISEGCAYRLQLQAARFNWAFSQLFLDEAEGEHLHRLARNFYEITPLAGANPTAPFEIELTAPRTTDTLIRRGFRLSSDENLFSEAIEDLVIPAGELSGVGIFELLLSTASSDVKTEILVNPQPYLKGVTQKSPFSNGGDPESDERLRQRCRDSQKTRSTAGSDDAYEFYARTADSRISQVRVISPEPCEVNVIYWAETMDAAMMERVEKALSASTVRPLSDRLTVIPAENVFYDVRAELTIPPNGDQLLFEREALAEAGKLRQLERIGGNITRFQIANILAGNTKILNVNVIEPAADVACDERQIPRLRNVDIVAS